MAADFTFSEAVLFQDDSVCVRYVDGRVLQLSPCASVFLFHRPEGHPVDIQQFTRFAVSSFRAEVTAAVNLRNQFAARPYLCKELLNTSDLVANYKEINECSWPVSVIPDFVVHEDNGAVRVHSLDGFAQLVLAPHRQTFTTRYLARVSPRTQQTKANQQSAGSPTLCRSSVQSPTQQYYMYTWRGQGEHSIHAYPDCWHYPLQLALSAASDDQESCHGDNGGCYGNNTSVLPCSLPVSCSSPHLHKWRPAQALSGSQEDIFWQPDVKAIWREGIIYRVYKGRPQGLQVQIYPGNGSVISSTSLSGKFFNWWSAASTTSGVQEKVISVDKPPPDRPDGKYSVARLVRQGSRLLEFISNIGLSNLDSSAPPCWKSKVSENIPVPPTPLTLLEKADIPGVGRFKAYSNGRLHAAFSDRTVLDIKYPKGTKDGTTQHSSLQVNAILPDGSLVQTTDGEIQGLERYIQLVQQWGQWVNSSPEQRREFYKNTMWDHDAARAVEAEINKLQRFNYIINGGAHSHYNPRMAQSNIEEMDSNTACYAPDTGISSVLQHTSNAIKDIENLLEGTKRSRNSTP